MSRTPKGYHQDTSYDRYAMEPHAMDWANQPNPYKSYPGLDGISLPEIHDISTHKLFGRELQAVYESDRLKAPYNVFTLEALSEICLLANGLTARSRQGNGYFYYRSAPSAGALYPNEMYFAAFDVENLPAGIYHCGIYNRFLARLRDGNFKKKIQAVIPALPQDSAGVFIVSGIFFRSAWKYRKRAYRYVLLDGGHLAENLRLAIAAAGHSCGLYHDFDDKKLDALIGLDAVREGSLCCISLSSGHISEIIEEPEISELPESVKSAGRVSSNEVTYSEIINMHEASREVKTSDLTLKPLIEDLEIALPEKYLQIPDFDTNPAVLNYPETVFNRRSKRNFIPDPISQVQLSYMLTLLCRASDSMINLYPDIASAVCTGFLSGNSEGIDPGFYFLDTKSQKTGQVANGYMIGKMTSICLDQVWLKHAAIHFVFMSNMEVLGKQWGARGYRYAMMAAGRLGHAVYLGATALGLGACGIGALYDNEARQLLGFNDESALLYLVAAGNTK